MDEIAVIFAKFAGLHKVITGQLAAEISGSRGAKLNNFDADLVFGYLKQYTKLREEIQSLLPDLYSDIPIREIPEPFISSSGRGKLFRRATLDAIANDLEYIFEVRANSQPRQVIVEVPRRVFIGHGRSKDWYAVQSFIEKDLGIETLEFAQEAIKGRTSLQKLSEESAKCSFAVIIMTGDDHIGADPPRARENVIHEIGFFQGSYGLANVCLLHEEGTNIPSNIDGLGYIPFPKGYINATFGNLQRELRTAFPEQK